ncbi:MAG: hypothetical protein JWO68_2121, partial [Actinomycetia bacterium]|nr:hypothetical protein [Actinomycetes bacterium]
TAAVFAAGHVGATVATTVAIWLQVRSGVGGGELTYAVDVGASYGVAAVAGVLVSRLRRPWSTVAAAGLVGLAAIALLRTGTFTDWGHMCALVIGLALAPLVRPGVTPGDRRRLGRLGGGLLLGAAAVVVVVLLSADTDVVLPPPAALAATVLGPVRCGRGCDEVRVRLAAGTAVLRLPAGADASAGRTVAVRPVGGQVGQVRLARVAHRVSVSGLLGEVAVAAAGVGLVLLLTVGRGPRATVRP